eukprot:CAMPEP_0115316850 /NCGR_PEP_ID=MMETSP0270-20121206/78347_1 /TAXON_ID=71861 /ORGANISM="Scrippsiella trochoidea, Strain CCMP3099" /LENGTH=67 /DNA_ID=CAMNT_0002736293 /DNA_START=17 /DNA_END=217 /DNA_ORIENTATION=+
MDLGHRLPWICIECLLQLGDAVRVECVQQRTPSGDIWHEWDSWDTEVCEAARRSRGGKLHTLEVFSV